MPDDFGHTSGPYLRATPRLRELLAEMRRYSARWRQAAGISAGGRDFRRPRDDSSGYRKGISIEARGDYMLSVHSRDAT